MVGDMIGDFASSMDLLAAVFTFAYIGKLLFDLKNSPESESLWLACQEKRSLHNQQVQRKMRLAEAA